MTERAARRYSSERERSRAEHLDDRHHRGLTQEAGEGAAQALGTLQFFEIAFVLVGIEAVDDLALADARPDRLQPLEAALEGDEAEAVLEEHRRAAAGPTTASGSASTPRRVELE